MADPASGLMGDGAGAPVRFLVVEDDAALVRRYLRPYFARFGEVTVVDSEPAAMELLRDDIARWDGYWIDIGLRLGSGLTVLEAIRSAGSRAPAVVCSVLLDERTFRDRAYRASAYLLDKPIDVPAHVVPFVQEVLEYHRRRSSFETDVAFEAKLLRLNDVVTVAEARTIELAALGYDRAQIAAVRGVEESTVKTQERDVAKKTGMEFGETVARLLRNVARR